MRRHPGYANNTVLNVGMLGSGKQGQGLSNSADRQTWAWTPALPFVTTHMI